MTVSVFALTPFENIFAHTFADMFSYEFYLDGSIKVTVRASGYIEGAGAVGNHEYGYRIHGGYSGSMHDHVLNFKVDFDIEGTKNTMQLTSFVPTNQEYLWTKEPRETFKLKREIIQSEDNSRLDWDRKTQYAIVRGPSICAASSIAHPYFFISTNVGSLLLGQSRSAKRMGRVSWIPYYAG